MVNVSQKTRQSLVLNEVKRLHRRIAPILSDAEKAEESSRYERLIDASGLVGKRSVYGITETKFRAQCQAYLNRYDDGQVPPP